MSRDNRDKQRIIEEYLRSLEHSQRDNRDNDSDEYIEKQKTKEKPKRQLTQKQLENLQKMREKKKIISEAKKMVQKKEEPKIEQNNNYSINPDLINKIDVLTDYIGYKIKKKEMKQKKPTYEEDEEEIDNYSIKPRNKKTF